MKRRPRPSSDQPDLFAARAPAWVAAHWPDYVRGPVPRLQPTKPPLEQWAESFTDLDSAARVLLVTIARGGAAPGEHVTISIPSLARSAGIARNTCRRYLDALLQLGLVLIRPMRSGAACHGYEAILVVDDEDFTAAIQAGFGSSRITTRGPVGKALNDG